MKPIQIISYWERVRTGLLETIDKFSEQELHDAPFKGSWQIGQIMLHIADCEDNWLHGVVRHELEPWIFYKLRDYPTKAQIITVLNRSRQRTLAFLETLQEADLSTTYAILDGTRFSLRWIIWHVLEHEIHHRGELSLALGFLGREGLDV